MPEENKEKKATPLAPAKEAKKDSFTFSDKIKESKSGGSKSFANRISSKIGRDGKPKQTIFERTKRDAPFLIAALVALLLLPFLYKYSGSVSDGDKMITPGSEEQYFNPNERYAFASDMEDPDQIAQLSGRDSLDLIRSPYAAEEEEMTGTDYRGSYDESYRDAYAGAKTSDEDTNVDIEENTTNIYKKRGKAATRAAFKRAATKINGMPNSSLKSGRGDKLAVGNWGGGLKGAAKKAKADTPTSSPKPVSLQPLQAAAKPSRSAFGNTAAAMRQSKDALSKADAKQALRDADIKPVEAGSFGGMSLGNGTFGSGSGDLKRNFNFQTKEPWWWDLMKTRSQMEWEEQFKRKWNWIKWGDELAQNILKGLINCLVTGNSDGDPDSFLGSGGGSVGKVAKCCGKKQKIAEPLIKQAGGTWGEDGCKTLQLSLGKDKCPSGWEAGRDGGGARVGIVRSRLSCLGLNIGGKYGVGEAGLTEDSVGGECADLFVGKTPKFRVVPTGAAQKWHTYHWVVAHNYVPLTFTEGKAGQNGVLLCSEGSDHLQMASHYSANGATDYLTSKERNYTAEYAAYEKAKKSDTFADYLAKKYSLDSATKKEIEERERAANWKSISKQDKEKLIRAMCDLAYDYSEKANVHVTDKQQILGDIYPRTDDLCVIYLAQGNQFEYGQFQKDTVEMLTKLIQNSKGLIKPQGQTEQQMAEKAFAQLDLAFIEAASMKQKLGYAKWGQSGNKLPEPILYDRFENAYIIHRGTTASATGSRNDVNKRKYRLDGEEYVRSNKCYFDADVHLECEENSEPPFATIRKGNLAAHPVGQINVHVEYVPEKGEKIAPAAKADLEPIAADAAPKTYMLTWTIPTLTKETPLAEGVLNWTVNYSRDGKPFSQSRQCRVSTESTDDGGTDDCKPGDENKNAKCCIELKGKDGYVWLDGKCIPDPCPQGADTSAECCLKFHPTGYHWDINLKKCRKDGEELAESETRLAPVISWVSRTHTDRKPVDPAKKPTVDTYTHDFIPKAFNDRDPYQHCGIPDSLVMNSKAAADWTKKVVTVYNEKHKDAINSGAMPQLSDKFQHGQYPNDAEFIDALNIANSLGIQKVPASAVCELGRDMARMSRDKHVGHKKIPNKNHNYRNELGAFLAYVHPASMLYPATRHWGTCDERFQSKYAGDGGCAEVAKGNNVPNAYHHNNYNNIGMPNIYNKRYEPSLKELGIYGNNGFPLQELAQANAGCNAFKDKYQNCGKCRNEVNAYNKDSGCALMYRDTNEGNGNACEAFAGNKEMSVAKAVEYVQTVCDVGLDQKPYGAGNKDKPVKPSQNTTGVSGNEGTERGI